MDMFTQRQWSFIFLRLAAVEITIPSEIGLGSLISLLNTPFLDDPIDFEFISIFSHRVAKTIATWQTQHFSAHWRPHLAQHPDEPMRERHFRLCFFFYYRYPSSTPLPGHPFGLDYTQPVMRGVVFVTFLGDTVGQTSPSLSPPRI